MALKWGFFSGNVAPLKMTTIFAKKKPVPMKSVYMRATGNCFVMIDMMSHYIFAKHLSEGLIGEIMYVLNSIALVVGMPERIYYDGKTLQDMAFATFCQIQDIQLKPYASNSNAYVQALANYFISLVHYENLDPDTLTLRLWEMRSYAVFNPRAFDGTTHSPLRLFYKRFEGDNIYRYAIQPAARSPMNSVGLANIKYVRYPSMLKEIESIFKKKIRYVLLGSSNAKGLELVQPRDDIFNIVDFTNISEGGMSASRMNGKDKYFNSYLAKHEKLNFLHDTEHHTIIIVFVGTNDYKHGEYDKYAASLLATITALTNRNQKSNFITLTPLPRGINIPLISKQMAIADKIVTEMRERGLRVVNAYNAIPHHLRHPSNLYDQSRNDGIHYSTEVRTHLSTVLSNLIKLDIQQLWLECNSPFTYQ